MPDVRVYVEGAQEVQVTLGRLWNATKTFNTTFLAGSARPYAYGINFGRHRVSGKLARRAGPTHFLTSAHQQVAAEVGPDLKRGLELIINGRHFTGRGMVRRIGRWVIKLAKARVPRRSGNLRRSLHTRVRRD